MSSSSQISVNYEVLNQLSTQETRNIHDAMSSLATHHVGGLINLPQIIVVGFQSSGKSSVLEALTHIRFPAKKGICTRFVTELILRRSARTSFQATTILDDSLKSRHILRKSEFNEKDLPHLINEAKEYIGSSVSRKPSPRDVLRLEIQGPQIQPATIIDLPGIFPPGTDTQSTEDECNEIEDLVDNYTADKRSIILSVIAADCNLPDLNDNTTFLVGDSDPDGERTICVITKPDTLLSGSEEEAACIQMLKNQAGANSLSYSWHCVRNLSEEESEFESRDEIEAAFFKQDVWATVGSQYLGITNLRKRLSKLIYENMRKSLPTLISKTNQEMQGWKDELNSLGPSRATEDEMRLFLINIASDFQKLARDGIQGNYADPFFGNLKAEGHKLRAQLRTLNRAFQHILWTRGSSFVIQFDDELTSPDFKEPPVYLKQSLLQFKYDFPAPKTMTGKEVNLKLQQTASFNLGNEFPGIPSTELVLKLFQFYARPWKEIACVHIKHVFLVVKAFVDSVFKHLSGPPESSRTTEAILSTCVDPVFAKMEDLVDEKVQELLRPYAEGYPVALHTDFGVQPEDVFDKYAPADEEVQLYDDGEFCTRAVVDMMLEYYKATRHTFAVNIISLAIEGCLVSKIASIFTPAQISAMTSERLKELGSESEEVQERRAHLEKTIGILQNAAGTFQKYKPRVVTVLPPNAPSAPLKVKDSKALVKTTKKIVVKLPVVTPTRVEPTTTNPSESPESTATPEDLSTCGKSPLPSTSSTLTSCPVKKSETTNTLESGDVSNNSSTVPKIAEIPASDSGSGTEKAGDLGSRSATAPSIQSTANNFSSSPKRSVVTPKTNAEGGKLSGVFASATSSPGFAASEVPPKPATNSFEGSKAPATSHESTSKIITATPSKTSDQPPSTGSTVFGPKASQSSAQIPSAVSGLFSGTKSQTPVQPSPPSKGLFGGSNSQTSPNPPSAGGGLFGSNKIQTPEKSSSSTGFASFGQSSSQGGFSFSSASNSQAQPSSTGQGLFGGSNSQSPAKPASAAGGLFGSSQTQTPSQTSSTGQGLFGGSNFQIPAKPPSAGGGLFGSITTQTPAQSSLTGGFGSIGGSNSQALGQPASTGGFFGQTPAQSKTNQTSNPPSLSNSTPFSK